MSKTIWDKVRTPPSEALKGIKGGRLSGFTDIDPVWRLEIMTETFGPVGVGWTFEIVDTWQATVGDEVCVFHNIRLKYRIPDTTVVPGAEGWSEWIPGTGGSMLAKKALISSK